MAKHKVNTRNVHADFLGDIFSDALTDAGDVTPMENFTESSDAISSNDLATNSIVVYPDSSSQAAPPSIEERERLFTKFEPQILLM
jgi:hypothetical protein